MQVKPLTAGVLYGVGALIGVWGSYNRYVLMLGFFGVLVLGVVMTFFYG